MNERRSRTNGPKRPWTRPVAGRNVDTGGDPRDRSANSPNRGRHRHGRALRITALALLIGTVACAAPPPDLHETTLTVAGGSRPTVAVRPDGSVLAAWVESGEEGGNVLLARSADGIAFDAAVRVNDVPGDAAPHDQAPAQVVAGPGGDVYVVWQNNTEEPGRRFPYSDLRFARSGDGGRTFDPAITVNDDAGLPSSHTFHSVLVGADGTIWVAWIDGRARAAAEAAMSAPHPAGDGTSATPAPDVAMGHHMAEADLPGSQIRIARSTDGGRTFEPSVLVADVACPCCRTALALGPDGTLALAWRGVRDTDIREVVVARSTDGGASFDEPVIVHRDGWHIEGCPHAGPSLAWDGEGRLHVAWYTGVEGAPGLFHAESTDDGASFGPPAPIMAAEWVPVSLVSLATTADGRVWAAWDDRRTEPVTVTIAPLDDLAAGARLAGKAPSIAAGATPAVAVLDGEAVRVVTFDP